MLFPQPQKSRISIDLKRILGKVIEIFKHIEAPSDMAHKKVWRQNSIKKIQ
jgi:hypothetical protein